MTLRFKMNALAVMVIAAGGISLSGPARAEAAAFDCDGYIRDRDEAAAACAASGGTKFTSSGWCNSTGHFIETNCLYEPE